MPTPEATDAADDFFHVQPHWDTLHPEKKREVLALAFDRFAAQRGAEELERVATWLDRIGEHDHADSLKATILNRYRESAPQTGGGDAPQAARGTKYNATRMDIVNDFYDEIQKAIAKYVGKPDALTALDEIESIAVWWANAPAVVQPSRAAQSSETGGGDAGERARVDGIVALAVNDAAPHVADGIMLLHWRVQRALEIRIAAALRDSHREGAEAMREALLQALLNAGSMYKDEKDKAVGVVIALPIPGSKTDAG